MSPHDISVEIDIDEMPQILSYRKSNLMRYTESEILSETKRQDYNREEDIEVLYIELEQRGGIIKKLQGENATIIRERDETLEEYEDEIKSLREQNGHFHKENLEIKQEIKILYNQIEDMEAKDEVIANLLNKVNDLDTALMENEEIIKELRENKQGTTRRLSAVVHQSHDFFDNSDKDHELVSEKNILTDRITGLNIRYLEAARENEELKNELVLMKLKYAEAETQKDGIHSQFADRIRREKIPWDILKFWKKST